MNYERLTKRTPNGKWEFIDEQNNYSEALNLLGNCLAELENKLESGRLVELPCAVGDTVYYVEYFCNYKGCGADKQTYCCGCKEMLERERKHEKYVIAEKKFALKDLSGIDKKYFTTKAAAEARLKELQGGSK